MVSIHRPLGYGPSTLPLRYPPTIKNTLDEEKTVDCTKTAVYKIHDEDERDEVCNVVTIPVKARGGGKSFKKPKKLLFPKSIHFLTTEILLPLIYL